MNETPAPSRPLPWTWIVLLVVLVLLAAGGWTGWRWWQARSAEQQRVEGEARQRWDALEQNLEALRRDQRAANLRLQDAAATNRVLRDEVLGLSQRGALLEDTVARLADSNRHGAQALRLDEVELLLNQGQQRLAIAGDLEGARRAYALAASALDGVDDPAFLNLRQTLVQERNALDSAGQGPQQALAETLERTLQRLDTLPRQSAEAEGDARPWWQKLLSPLVQIRPSRGNALIAQSERSGAQDSLQIEISLARAALERNDEAAWRLALRRIDAWMVRLWPDSPPRRQLQRELSALGTSALRPRIPELGSTLMQLKATREGRTGP